VRLARHIIAAAALSSLAAGAAVAQTPPPSAVSTVVDGRFLVGTDAGSGSLPIFVSQDWAHPLPAIRRVVIVVHGFERNADEYAKTVTGLSPPADTMVIAPQFLAPEDAAGRDVADDVLRWGRDRWDSGWPAEGQARVSSFDAIDALLATLGNRTMLPNLTAIVLAGFSAGGQLVQRYAAVGRGEAMLDRDGVRMRYVVGSPGSYLYFDDARPGPGGILGVFAGAAECPDFNRWKYGFGGALPPYVAALTASPADLEKRFAARPVVYLLGTADSDPEHRVLDKSCAAEAQGPNRYARGVNYFHAMRARNALALKQVLAEAPGAAHSAAKVFGSPCGRAALFDEKDCPGGLR
jgi:hypothetical protein